MKCLVRHSMLILLALVIIGSVVPVRAEVTFPDKPPSQDYFVDKANVINEKDRAEIDKIAGTLLREQRIPIFVVTIDSLSSYGASALGVEGYATQLFNHWGIGTPDRNYGILLLVSVGDRKARIEFGAGFAHAHDAQADDVMQSLILPAFKRGDFSTGIVDGVRGLDAAARGLQLPMPTVPPWIWIVLIGGGVLLVVFIVNLFKSGKSGWAWALLAALGIALFFLMRNAGKGDGGSSDGFGGGSSGGGGATGSW
jgi:uncharacterized protein